MKTIQTFLSALVLVCSLCMLYCAITTPGVMKNYSIAFAGLLTAGSVLLVGLTVTETDN